MSRFWPVLASLALASVALPRLARADVAGGTVQVLPKIPVKFNNGASEVNTDYRDANEEDERRYFNLSRCQCDKELGKPQKVMLELSWATQPTGSVNEQLYGWAGTGCPGLMQNDRTTQCSELQAVAAAKLVEVPKVFEPVGKLLTPSPAATKCLLAEVTGVYTISSSDDGGANLTQEAEAKFVADMLPPAAPTSVTVDGLEESIRLSWTAPSSVADYKYYQALCSRADGTPAHVLPDNLPDPTHEREYDTTFDVCEVAPTAPPAAMIANPTGFTTDAAANATSVPADLLKLGEGYLCGQASGSATSIVLEGLENGEAYWVVLLAIDAAGNYSAVHVPSTVVPVPVEDLWETLNETNSELEGGFCLVESTFGGGGGIYGALRAWRDDLRATAAGSWLVDRYYQLGAPVAAAARASVVVRVVVAIVLLPLIAIALAWHLLTLPGLLVLAAALVLWRRRSRLARRPRRAAAAFATAMALIPSIAAAQEVTPYWEDPDAENDLRVALPTWHLDVRLGPYWPSIDDKFAASPGPYEKMFSKGAGLLPMLDLHRLISTRFGQFGLGVAGGYFSNDAPSYRSDGTQSIANRTRLRIIPMELTAIYRVSQLDDQWGVPVVPYLRGGLGYYVWWITRPDGKVSDVCETDEMSCVSDRARGASMGLVAAAGLSLRAERIDPDGARSMRDSGIEHAGFFAEVSTAWVDGFGSEKKMSLGDTTWSGGIDFEF